MTTTLAFPAALPGPIQRWGGLPEVLSMRRDYLGHMRHLHQRYGDVVRQSLLGLTDYNFFHPDHVRELLIASHDGMIRWKRATRVFADAHGQSVLVAEGQAWQRQRRLLQPGFSPRSVESFVPLMIDAGRQALDRLPRADTTVDFEGLVTSVTMDVILRTLFSADIGATDAGRASWAVHALGKVGMAEMFLPVTAPLWAPWKSTKRQALQVLDGLILSQLARRRQSEGIAPEVGGAAAPHADLLAMLLALRDEQGRPLDDTAVRDECMTIFLAGHETSAAALTWWGWCMAAHPEAQRRAIDEVHAVLGERPPTSADLPRLPWLSLCIKEVLRLYPPAPALFSRQATSELHVAGLTLPPGSMIRLTPAVIQRDPRWFEEPDAFRPERFDPAAGHPDIPRGAWLPFGAGPRVCLGSHFALTEITLLAAMILQRHALAPAPDDPPPAPVLNITLRPERPLRLRLRPH